MGEHKWCRFLKQATSPNDYCSYGKRREDGDTDEALRDKPKGEWILEYDGGNEYDNLYKCSKCGVEYGCEEYDKPNFCPNCGTDMRNGM